MASDWQTRSEEAKEVTIDEAIRAEIEQRTLRAIAARLNTPIYLRINTTTKIVHAGTSVDNAQGANWGTPDNPTWLSAALDALIRFLSAGA